MDSAAACWTIPSRSEAGFGHSCWWDPSGTNRLRSAIITAAAGSSTRSAASSNSSTSSTIATTAETAGLVLQSLRSEVSTCLARRSCYSAVAFTIIMAACWTLETRSYCSSIINSVIKPIYVYLDLIISVFGSIVLEIVHIMHLLLV